VNLHPGALASLRLLNGDELDIAEMMAAGDLTSPQFVGNMWLFRLRVSGVGYAYRPKHDEWVYRRPENYLTDRFLKRVNGLMVIWEHPPKAVLDSKEFSKRHIGGVMLPYLGDRNGAPPQPGQPPEDVWAIARIYDKSAAEEMSTGELSTSPSVVFRDPGVNLKIDNEDGTSTLIEGPASLVDHVAICANGVWDKEEPPSGVPVDHPDEKVYGDALQLVAQRIDALVNRVDMFRVYDRLTRSSQAREYGAHSGAHHGRSCV